MGKKIAIIGGGNLGTAIAEGLIKSRFALAADISVTRRNYAALAPLAAKGVHTGNDNLEAIRQSDVIILAIKPFQVSEVLQSVKKAWKPGQLLISVVSGVLIDEIQGLLPRKLAVCRAMPNTAIAIRESMTCLSFSAASPEQIEWVTALFSALGKAVLIDEKLMDAATVLGACGTAYAMRYIRANIQGGIEIGFDAKTANLIAAQTVKGAAELLLQKGTHPEQEIDKVTTPKGCTIAGLNEMEHQGFSSSLIKGIASSFKKIQCD